MVNKVITCEYSFHTRSQKTAVYQIQVREPSWLLCADNRPYPSRITLSLRLVIFTSDEAIPTITLFCLFLCILDWLQKFKSLIRVCMLFSLFFGFEVRYRQERLNKMLRSLTYKYLCLFNLFSENVCTKPPLRTLYIIKLCSYPPNCHWRYKNTNL